MRVCVCVYVYVCMHVCVCALTCTKIDIHVCSLASELYKTIHCRPNEAQFVLSTQDVKIRTLITRWPAVYS